MHIGCSRKLRADLKHNRRHLCTLSVVVPWMVSSTYFSSSRGDCRTLLPVALGPSPSSSSVPSTCGSPLPRVHALKGDLLPPTSVVFCLLPFSFGYCAVPPCGTNHGILCADRKQQEFGSATNTAVLLRLVLGAGIFVAHVPSDEASLETAISQCIGSPNPETVRNP